MKLFKQKEKRYKLSAVGIAQMMLDDKKAKLDKINGYTSIAVILIMFGFGLLSKEILIILLANKGINAVTSLMVG